MQIVVFLFFFISGFCALIYEIIWSRILSLLFGVSVYGQAMVLGLFMGGMALGALLGGQLIRKSNKPVFWYGFLEITIGAFGISSLLLSRLFDWGLLHTSLPFPVIAGLTSLLILPSTISMGATFPVLFKVVSGWRLNQDPLSRVSGLYSSNTLGAIMGIIVCNYFLIVPLGMKRTLLLVSFLNILTGVGFWLLFNKKENVEKASKNSSVRSFAIKKSPLLALAASGFITMLYEISWSRALYFSLGSSTFTFSLIIFCFITGLSLGAFFVKRKKNLSRSEKQAMVCDFQTKGAIAASVFIFLSLRMPLISDYLFKWCGDGYLKLHLMEILILLLLITPIAFYSGASFPLLCIFTDPEDNPTEKHIGFANTYNTAGAIIGVALTGFWLLKTIGPFQTVWIGLGLHLVIIILIRPSSLLSVRNNLITIFTTSVFLTIQFLYAEPMDLQTGYYARVFKENSSSYLPQYLQNDSSFWKMQEKKAKMKKAKPYELKWIKHGLTCSVAILENNVNTRLVINGKTDASTGQFHSSDMPTQTLLAMLPLSLSKQKNKGLVVGYGSGVTAGILGLLTPEVDCLEIEKAVLDASIFFKQHNFDALNQQNIKIFKGDARRFIHLASSETYDYISSEPSNIWMAGVANLFTREYFENCYRILKKQGVMVQWVHIYKLSLKDFKTVIKTFSKAFPNFEIWGFLNTGDLFLAGWKGTKPALSETTFDNFFERYPYQNEMKEMNAGSWKTFQRFRLISSEKILPLLSKTPIHSDDLPVLEYSAAKNMFCSDLEEIYRFLGQ